MIMRTDKKQNETRSSNDKIRAALDSFIKGDNEALPELIRLSGLKKEDFLTKNC